LTITLADDGKGFDPYAVGGNGHFGLAIMQDRAREINGRLTLTSRPGGGTQVALCLPLDPTPGLL
jgi:signal transduction histidine kinase